MQSRKLSQFNLKSKTSSSALKNIMSPEPKLWLTDENTKPYLKSVSSVNKLVFPTLNTNICDYGIQFRTISDEAKYKVKSSSEITEISSPRLIINKLKRIKSQQSFISSQKTDSMKKLSIKCKVYVTNPFIRKLSRNVENSILEQSKIVDN